MSEALRDLVTSLAAEFEHPLHLLLIDDSPDDRTLALRYLLQQDYAVILMDVQMPEMDGFETVTSCF